MGASLFELMHGRKRRTKLNVLSPPAMTVRDDVLRHRVFLRQKHMKKYFDDGKAWHASHLASVPTEFPENFGH